MNEQATSNRVRVWLARKFYPGEFAEVMPDHFATTAGTDPAQCNRCSTPVAHWSSRPCASYMGRIVYPSYKVRP